MNKKVNKKFSNENYEDLEFHLQNKTKKLRQRELKEMDLGFDEDDDSELFQQVQRFLK